MKMWKSVCAGLLVAALLPISSLAAEKLDLKGIGRMTVPKNVTFEKGAQDALPFLSAGGTEQFFLRRGMTGSVYYTMTYADPPDFSYGWAMSHKLGVSYLLGIGAVSHKDDPAEAQLDLIAADLNERLIASGASFDGEAPLVKSRIRSIFAMRALSSSRRRKKMSHTMRRIRSSLPVMVISQRSVSSIQMRIRKILPRR